MVRKIFISSVLIVLFSTAAFAAALEKEMYDAVEQMGKAYSENYEVSKYGKEAVLILGIVNESERSEKNNIAKAVSVYAEKAFADSTVFRLVDRQNTDKLLEEMELSASGLTSADSSVKLGELTAARFALSGVVTGEGSDFLVALKLIETESSEVVETVSFRIPQSDLIASADEVMYSYVSENGIGLEYSLLIGFNKPTILSSKPLMSMQDISVYYRFSKNIMLGAGVMFYPSEFTGGTYSIRNDLGEPDPDSGPDDELFSYYDYQPELSNEFSSQFTNGYIDTGMTTDGAGYDQGNKFEADFNIKIIHLDFQYTHNFRPFFNLGFRGSLLTTAGPPTMSLTTDLIYKDYSVDPSTPTSNDYVLKLEENPVEYTYTMGLGAKAEVRPEFFITPRLALNAKLGFMWMGNLRPREVHASAAWWDFGGENKDWEYEPGNPESMNNDASDLYYGWDPRKLPNGEELKIDDFAVVYSSLGLSFFF